MSSCVVCSVPTTKYRCPQCFVRYCSVVCCKTHKETCVKENNDPKPDESAQMQNLKENDYVFRETVALEGRMAAQRSCKDTAVGVCNVHKINLASLLEDKLRLDIDKSRERQLLIQSQVNEDEDDDRVPVELLQQLEHNPELKVILSNPHLRAMLENLVKADKPETAMALAMHEPIFTEFADACLQIVDKNNPNIEHAPADVST